MTISTGVVIVVVMVLSLTMVNSAMDGCATCETGVPTYFDGCNNCTCDSASGEPTCTGIECSAEYDNSVCGGKCDGFKVPSDDGCGECTCVSGRVNATSCTLPRYPCRHPCQYVNCSRGKVCVAAESGAGMGQQTWACVPADGEFCGCHNRTCKSNQSCNSQGWCEDFPQAKWFDKFATACASPARCCGDDFVACRATESCVSGRCVTAINLASACKAEQTFLNYACSGYRRRYFDGCNHCTCMHNSGVACTDAVCAADVLDPHECTGQWDGFVTTPIGECGSCTCKGGVKTMCSSCGVDEHCTDDNVCAINTHTIKCELCAGDSNCDAVPPNSTRCDNQCDGFVTEDVGCGSCVCTQGMMSNCTKCGEWATCESNQAGGGQCRERSPCTDVACGPDNVCVDESKKECGSAPCPRHRCEPRRPCGCADPTAQCGKGMTCKDNSCQQMIMPAVPVGYIGGVPRCERVGAECCGGAGIVCGDNEICDKNKCIPKNHGCTPPPGVCYTCDSVGILSFFNGCNRCTCYDDRVRCNLKGCYDQIASPTQCDRQCDGFVTDDDGVCGTCLCINGEKTLCSKSNRSDGKCVTVDSAKAIAGRTVAFLTLPFTMLFFPFSSTITIYN